MPRWAKAVAIVLVVIVGATILWWQMSYDESSLRLDGHRYHVSIMRTDAELQKGLSGTSSLPEGNAMLFAFPYSNRWSIWMKDMKYPIDIIWLNAQKQVIYTVRDAQPSSYPNTFKPDQLARYVIEFPSGTIERTGIKNGDPVGLPSSI